MSKDRWKFTSIRSTNSVIKNGHDSSSREGFKDVLLDQPYVNDMLKRKGCFLAKLEVDFLCVFYNRIMRHFILTTHPSFEIILLKFNSHEFNTRAEDKL